MGVSKERNKDNLYEVSGQNHYKTSAPQLTLRKSDNSLSKPEVSVYRTICLLILLSRSKETKMPHDSKVKKADPAPKKAPKKIEKPKEDK
jgi:hypothetical protein